MFSMTEANLSCPSPGDSLKSGKTPNEAVVSTQSTGRKNLDEMSRLVGVLRHSERLDNEPSASWEDKTTRPYDTPINNLSLPREQARKITQIMNKDNMVIVSSPLRRCLQTARELALTLEISSVYVHLGLSELQYLIKSQLRTYNLTGTFTILDTDSRRRELGTVMENEPLLGVLPDFNESPGEGHERFASVIENIHQELFPTNSILIVSHGDALSAVGGSFVPPSLIYDTRECSFVVFEPASKRLVSHSRLLFGEFD
eukprot:TRINITY_DN7923_c0_g1_i1.p1 TRINITY_DN7923_c0_g1~~TRINITY_DN7923_c0_g1_i1.p1  ORF type:complete len:258 (-),score=38.90 TRINITY_DN7923_c0_g1_i1:31-804(-)